MYNSIYPININYRKANPYQKQNANNASNDNNSGLPNNAAQGDVYTPSSNRINISQILMDFRNTILAINAPDDVQDEVNAYLNLVDKESKKENPSRDIIISNLKNASKVSDAFITSALGKPSTVVEGWITTIFRQDINLKSNPDEINPDFLLKFPEKPQQQATPVSQEQIINQEQNELDAIKETDTSINNDEIDSIPLQDSESPSNNTQIIVDSTIDTPEDTNIFANQPTAAKATPFGAYNDDDERAKVLYFQAKRASSTQDGSQDALNMLNEALGYMSDNSNSNIKAAIHFERGKIFDSFDYVDYALRDYYEATKADDLNLKANAFYKSGMIYDEFKEYDPALDNYLSSVAYSGEADNLSAQSRVLSKISEMYAKLYDVQNAHNYADLAIDAALDSENSSAIANTYSAIAQNYQHLGEDKNAIDNYKMALKEYHQSNESYDEMAYNYSQAAIVMRNLGNNAKAEKLQYRANQYYQKAQLQRDLLEQAS